MKELVDFIKTFDMHTIIIVGVAFWWLNSSITDKDGAIQIQFKEIRSELAEVKSDIRVIKTVLTMKGIMNNDLAYEIKNNDQEIQTHN